MWSGIFTKLAPGLFVFDYPNGQRVDFADFDKPAFVLLAWHWSGIQQMALYFFFSCWEQALVH